MNDDLKRQLGFWIEGQNMEEYQQYFGEPKEFNGDQFIDEISRKRKQEIDSIDEKRLSDTDKAFHLAFNQRRRQIDDGDKNDQIQQEQQEPPLGRQRCENNQCPGTDTKWIECSYGKCWYHLGCAGIAQNMNQEELNELDWICKKCKKIKELKKK